MISGKLVIKTPKGCEQTHEFRSERDYQGIVFWLRALASEFEAMEKEEGSKK